MPIDLPGDLRGPHVPVSAAMSPKTRRNLHTTETGAPAPYYGLPGLTDGGVLGWQQFDEREYAPDLKWAGGESGSTQIYERMQTDAQCKGLLLTTTMPVRRKRWEVDPNGARDLVTRHVAESWNLPIRGDEGARIRGPGFNHDRHLAHALAAIAFGHYYFERVYRIGDDGLAYLDKLATRPPRTIWNFLTGPHGELLGIAQKVGNVGNDQVGFTKIDANSLLPYVWEPADDGDWIGRSMLRSLYRNWLLKDRLIRVDATKHERNSMGIPWFEADPTATPDEIARLAVMAQEMRTGSRGGGAGKGKLRIAGVEGTLPDVVASIRYHDQQMASAFLADFVTLGKGETGSYSLGAALIEFHSQMIGAICDWYVEASQAQIEDEVLINWGPDEKCPRLAWTSIESQELELTPLAEAVEKGLFEVDPEFRQWAGERFRVPGQDPESIEAHEEAQAAKAPQIPQPEPGATGDGTEGSDGGGGGTTETTGGTVPVEEHTRSAPAAAAPARSALADAMLTALKAPMPWAELAAAVGKDPKNGTARRARDQLLAGGAIMKRVSDGRLAPMAGLQLPDRELRRNPSAVEVEAAVDFATMEATYVGIRSALVAAANAAKPAQIADLAAQAEAADRNPVKLAKLTAKPIDADVLTSHLIEAAEAGVRSAQSEHAAQAALGGSATAVDSKMPVQAALEKNARQRAEVAANTLASGMGTSASKKASSVSTLEPAETARMVTEHLNSLTDAALNEQLGGAVQHAYNGGRFEYMKMNAPKTVYASEILDTNTCVPCSAEDGTEWATVEEAETDYAGQGGFVECEGGDRCRGTLVAVY